MLVIHDIPDTLTTTHSHSLVRFHAAVVEIDMREPSFRAGKKGFERTKRLLSAWPRTTSLFDELAGVRSEASAVQGEGAGRRFDMLFAFVDEQGECGSGRHDG